MVWNREPVGGRRVVASARAPNLSLSWISLLIGGVVVAVSISDPVVRMTDHVRAHGPIVVTSETPAGLSLAGVLPEPRLFLASRADEQPAAVPAPPDVQQVKPAPEPAPEQDAHLWDYMVATAPAREAELGLTRATRAELQRRLALIGYDPRGVDGVLGPLSREAIAAWQRDFGFHQTGYVDAVQLASIEERSATAWNEWDAARVRYASMAAPSDTAPEASVPPDGRSECERGDDGRIVGKQSFGCDLKGVREGFQRLFSKLGDDEAIATASAPLPADR